MKFKIIIGTRGSDLALWQANHVKAQLENLSCEVEIKIIKTQGDQIQHLSFDKMEGKGFFTKEIEAALLNNDIDLAIHSHKDLETTPTPGLVIAAVSPREDPSDYLLMLPSTQDNSLLYGLKTSAIVGTSSARRKGMLKAFRADVVLKDLRGNVPTRIEKLRQKEYDAILLAGAGLNRLQIDLSEFVVKKLNPREFIPAPAQGVLGLQTRENDTQLIEIVKKLNDNEVEKIIGFERSVLRSFQGGCQLPLGVYCEKLAEGYHVWGALGQEYGNLQRVNFISTNLQSATKKMVDALKKKVAL